MTKSDKRQKSKQKSDKQVSVKSTDKLVEILRIMDNEGLDELEIADGPFQVKLVRQSAMPQGMPSHAIPERQAPRKKIAQEKVEEDSSHTPIKSPLAGVFYRSPSPSAPPFIKEGDVVTPDKTLCIIEAMKVLNEINAGVSGRIVKIMVENGKPISTGQVLFLVEPTA